MSLLNNKEKIATCFWVKADFLNVNRSDDLNGPFKYKGRICISEGQ